MGKGVRAGRSDASERAAAISEGAPENLRDRARELAENVLWMEERLEATRREIADDPVAIPYDNGGGQRGVRRNPAFDGYNALVSSYTRALRQLCEIVGAEEPEEEGGELDRIIAEAAKSR